MKNNNGKITRKSIDSWLRTNSGDFQKVLGWSGPIGKHWYSWQTPELEEAYLATLGEGEES